MRNNKEELLINVNAAIKQLAILDNYKKEIYKYIAITASRLEDITLEEESLASLINFCNYGVFLYD